MKLIQKLQSKLSASTFQLVRWVYSFASFVGCVPFRIHDPAQISVREVGRWKLIFWHLSNWTYVFQFLFKIPSFIYQMNRNPFDKHSAVHLCFLMMYTFGFVNMMATYLSPAECIHMLNQQVRFTKSLPSLRLPEYKFQKDPFVMFSLHYYALVCSSGWLLLTIFVLLKPDRSCYLYSYFPPNWKESWLIYGVSMMLEITTMLHTSAIWTTHFAFWAQNLFLLTRITKKLMKQKTVTELMLETYIHLEHYWKIFMSFNGNFFLVGYCFAAVGYPVAQLFVILRHFETLSVGMQLYFVTSAIFSIILIVVITPQDAKVRIRSVDLLQEMTRRHARALSRELQIKQGRNGLIAADRTRAMTLRLKAMRPITTPVWFFGHISIGTTQHMLNQLFNNELLLLSL